MAPNQSPATQPIHSFFSKQLAGPKGVQEIASAQEMQKLQSA